MHIEWICQESERTMPMVSPAELWYDIINGKSKITTMEKYIKEERVERNDDGTGSVERTEHTERTTHSREDLEPKKQVTKTTVTEEEEVRTTTDEDL